jgi:SAM-dependent MidA family methyltransferase
VTETATILRQEVQQKGGIPFFRFMELALYCPDSGYYEQPQRRIGRAGDFITSVSAGSLFGELLACQIASWFEASDDSPRQLVEAGAHDGQFAFDVLAWTVRHRPALFETLEYWLVEPSSRRQSWQREKLDKFADRVRWVKSLDELAASGVNGLIFSNELLDAFPVHRLGWDAVAQEWFEWGVGLAGGDFIWRREPKGDHDWKAELTLAGFDLPSSLEAVIPDGFILELSPEATAWWRTAASLLKSGRLITIDYGMTNAELVAPESRHGTLRAYRQHRLGENLLDSPGEQDITAHVNFSELQRSGEEAGLTTETFMPQGRFLTRIAGEMWRAGIGEAELSQSQIRQFKTLTHPDHLGRSFRVLVQAR